MSFSIGRTLCISNDYLGPEPFKAYLVPVIVETPISYFHQTQTQPSCPLCLLLRQGANAEAILKLQPNVSFARRTEIATKTPTPPSEQPLSNHSDSHPGDIASSNNSPLTFLNEKHNGDNDQNLLGSANTPQLAASSTGGGGQRKGATRRSTRKKRRPGSKMVGSGRVGQGNSGGSEGGDLGVGNDARKPGPIESRGGREVTVRRRGGGTFCGWQRLLRNTDGSGGSDGSGGVSVAGQGEVTMGTGRVFANRDESNRTRDDEEEGFTALTTRNLNGRNYSGSGGGSSSVSTTTPLPWRQDMSLGRSYGTEDFSGRAESGSSVVDLASTMVPQGCPAMAATGSQVPGNQIDAPSVKPSFAARGSFASSSVAQHSDMDVDVAFRRPLHNRDAEFAGKNFGDSILGECGVTEGPGATTRTHDWSVREGCDSYAGGGADAVAVRGGRKDPGSTGLNSTSFDGSALTATLCGKDVPKPSGRGFGGVLSPNQLPSTPSPLSLDRPAYHSMQCLMGL